MVKQHQIKISVSKKLNDIIEERAEKLGMKKSTYCFHIIVENIRRDKDNG